MIIYLLTFLVGAASGDTMADAQRVAKALNRLPAVSGEVQSVIHTAVESKYNVVNMPVLLPDSDLSELLEAFNPSCPSTSPSDLDNSVAAINSAAVDVHGGAFTFACRATASRGLRTPGPARHSCDG